jgi:hypothetical protein
MGKPVKSAGKGFGNRGGFGGDKPSRRVQQQEEEVEEEFEEEMSEEDTEESILESVEFVKQYLSDPLKAVMTNPENPMDVPTANRVYAARSIVAQRIDPVLASTSELAAEYRALEQERMKTMKEKLFAPRGAAAEKEAAKLSAEDLANDGTGLMWGPVLGAAANSVSDTFPNRPFEFTEQDEAIFNHCLNIVPSYVDDDPFKGVSFEFTFAKNPFFSDRKLTCAFLYPTASLSLTKVGLEVPCVNGIRGTNPTWTSPHTSESIESKSREFVKEALFTNLLSLPSTSAAVKEQVKSLMCSQPQPLFTALFGMRTTTETEAHLKAVLLRGDPAADGRAVKLSQTADLAPWKSLAAELFNAVKAPMIALMDNDGFDAMYGDDEEEEEESDDDEEDADSEESDEGATDKKKHRAEGGSKKAPPPQECKQQ